MNWRAGFWPVGHMSDTPDIHGLLTYQVNSESIQLTTTNSICNKLPPGVQNFTKHIFHENAYWSSLTGTYHNRCNSISQTYIRSNGAEIMCGLVV